jgi:hypothetical protein
MRHPKLAVTLTLTSLALVGCTDAGPTTAPAAVASAAREGAGIQADRLVAMNDNCDPASFNESLGPGACVRNQRGMKFLTFIRVLTERQIVPAWNFNPEFTTVNFGDVFHARNFGGEVHTFTPVAQFGGGLVPELNELSGYDTIAPECLTLDEDDFVPAGGVYVTPADQRGTMLFECCIHPWMQTTAVVR